MNTTETETFEQRCEREAKERRQNITKGEKLIAAVCKLLGFTVEKRGEPNEHAVYLNAAKEGVRLRFVTGDYVHKWDRLAIGGTYPQGVDGEYIRPTEYNESADDEITVSASKTPEKIAADITRRLLPRVLELTARVDKKIGDARKYRQAVGDNMTLLKGTPPTDGEKKAGKFRLDGKDEVWGEVTVYDGQVTIDAHNLTVTDACKILAIIRGKK